jgi:hypothetical protein
MGSGAMRYIPSFRETDSGIQKLIGGIHRQQGDLIRLPSFFFQNKESGLIMGEYILLYLKNAILMYW